MKDFSLLHAQSIHIENISSQTKQQNKMLYNSELIEDLQIKLISEFLFPEGDVAIKSKGLLEFRNWVNKKYEEESIAELKTTLTEIKVKYKDVKGLIVGINIDEYYVPQALTIEKLICEEFSLNGAPNNLNRIDGLSSINSLSNFANQKDFQILGAFFNE